MATIFATTNDPVATTNDDEYTTQGLKFGVVRAEMAFRMHANRLVPHPRARKTRRVQRMQGRV